MADPLSETLKDQRAPEVPVAPAGRVMGILAVVLSQAKVGRNQVASDETG